MNETKVCELCGKGYGHGCTNRRCLECHGRFCGPGGETSPGHAALMPAQPMRPAGDAQQASERYVRMFASVRDDPGASFWLKAAATQLQARDPVDAYYDARALLELAADRMRIMGHRIA